MKYYDIEITFTISEKDYKRYDKNIDEAIDLIIPYGTEYEIKEADYDIENKEGFKQ